LWPIIRDIPGEPVSEKLLDFAEARDFGCGVGDNQNSLKTLRKSSAPSSNRHYHNSIGQFLTGQLTLFLQFFRL